MTKNVWYRSTPGSWIQDRGTVTVENGTLSFTGRKGTVSGRVSSAQTRSVGFSNWVKATYEAEGDPGCVLPGQGPPRLGRYARWEQGTQGGTKGRRPGKFGRRPPDGLGSRRSLITTEGELTHGGKDPDRGRPHSGHDAHREDPASSCSARSHSGHPRDLRVVLVVPDQP